MTRTGFTFTSLAEAEEAWETVRAFLLLGHLTDQPMPGYKEIRDTMDRIGANIGHG